MQFGPAFAKVLFDITIGPKSQLVINGVKGKPFLITQSVRQGCPLSPILFILAAHALTQCVLRAQEAGTIQGISVPEIELEYVVVAYTDDTHFLLRVEYNNLVAEKKLLQVYSNATGLFIQWKNQRLDGFQMTHNLYGWTILDGNGKILQLQVTF